MARACNKLSLKDVISEWTSIKVEVLLGGDLENFGVAQRMSWASKRKPQDWKIVHAA
jgi:hypothetical protein